jgi:putative oxidoreductase
MSYGILLLRVVLGLTVASHGAQKLFGAFDGYGVRGTAGYFRGLGFRAPTLTALAAGLAEFGGGLLVMAGLLTPLGSLAIAVVMLNAIGTVHWKNGFWSARGGYEFNLLIWAGAVALAATGAGRFSLDALIGWEGNLSGLWWGVAVLGLSAGISAVTLTVGRRSSESRSPATERRAPVASTAKGALS